jgi:hypothetical protein
MGKLTSPSKPMQSLEQWKEERREIVLQMLFNAFMLIMFTIAVSSVAYMSWNVAKIAMWKQTNHVCLSLQEQAEVFKNHGFYITQWEADRCADYEIDAPIATRPVVND